MFNKNLEYSRVFFGESVPPEEWMSRMAEAEKNARLHIGDAGIEALTPEQLEYQMKQYAEEHQYDDVWPTSALPKDI